jgi:hypothetical protein
MTLDNHTAQINGGAYVSLAGLAALCGVSIEEARAEYDRQQAFIPGRFAIPKAWKRSAKELQARHADRGAP